MTGLALSGHQLCFDCGRVKTLYERVMLEQRVEEEMEEDDNLVDNKLRHIMQLEKVKESMRMLTSQSSDLTFVSKDGRSVRCHK